SGMLERSRGAFCNLILHELFHATFYVPGKVNLNENLANFFAHKGTVRFLASDSTALNDYLLLQSDRRELRSFLARKEKELRQFYRSLPPGVDRAALKLEMFGLIADSLRRLSLAVPSRAELRAKEILASKNAFFVGFTQYESLQDSLENAFNK